MNLQNILDFQKAFNSFTITSDLLSSLPIEKKQTLQGLFNKKPSFSEMESFLNEHFSEMGPYWAALLIQTLQPRKKMKRLISFLTMFALVFTQALHSDEQPETAPKEARHVGKASYDGVTAAKENSGKISLLP